MERCTWDIYELKLLSFIVQVILFNYKQYILHIGELEDRHGQRRVPAIYGN